YRAERVADLVMGQISSAPRQRVSILGLAYKANTPVVEESPALQIIDRLLQKRAEITVYDPLAMEGARAVFGDRISYAASVAECVTGCSVCVITTQADEFRRLDGSHFAQARPVVLDCWRLLDPRKLGAGVEYVPLGEVASPPEVGPAARRPAHAHGLV